MKPVGVERRVPSSPGRRASRLRRCPARAAIMTTLRLDFASGEWRFDQDPVPALLRGGRDRPGAMVRPSAGWRARSG